MLRPSIRTRVEVAAKTTGFAPALPLLLAEARECAYLHNATHRRAAIARPARASFRS